MNGTLLTVEEVANYLGVPKATIYSWASRGLGPRRHKVGRYVRYRAADIDAWVEAQAVPAGS
ncbi:helix-turn-helix transcriptional regulator [Geodermatophilus sp. SYSU D00867]